MRYGWSEIRTYGDMEVKVDLEGGEDAQCGWEWFDGVRAPPNQCGLSPPEFRVGSSTTSYDSDVGAGGATGSLEV